tara:strand:+ start:32700 stop:32942 length:243 start_codon:yes stop_codon:yes gene_type:complete
MIKHRAYFASSESLHYGFSEALQSTPALTVADVHAKTKEVRDAISKGAECTINGVTFTPKKAELSTSTTSASLIVEGYIS